MRLKQSGFTLPEAAVVSIIVALFAIVFFQFISNLNTKVSPNLTNRVILQMDGRNLADQVLDKIRQSSAIIRPMPGETTPFMLLRDAKNRICFYYLVFDYFNSRKFKKSLCELNLSINNPKTSKTENSKLGDHIESANFTGVSGTCVQLNLKIANDKSSFQFLSQAGLMSLGDSYE